MEADIAWPDVLAALTDAITRACASLPDGGDFRECNKSSTMHDEEGSVWPVGAFHERRIRRRETWRPFGLRWLGIPHRRTVITIGMEEVFPLHPRAMWCVIHDPRFAEAALPIISAFAVSHRLRLETHLHP